MSRKRDLYRVRFWKRVRIALAVLFGLEEYVSIVIDRTGRWYVGASALDTENKVLPDLGMSYNDTVARAVIMVGIALPLIHDKEWHGGFAPDDYLTVTRCPCGRCSGMMLSRIKGETNA